MKPCRRMFPQLSEHERNPLPCSCSCHAVSLRQDGRMPGALSAPGSCSCGSTILLGPRPSRSFGSILELWKNDPSPIRNSNVAPIDLNLRSPALVEGRVQLREPQLCIPASPNHTKLSIPCREPQSLQTTLVATNIVTVTLMVTPIATFIASLVETPVAIQ